MKTTDLKTIILAGAVAVLILLLILSKCSTSRQSIQDTDYAVAQNRIENLEKNISILQNENLSYRQAQDRLISLNDSLNKLIIQKDAKYAQIALNYVKEKNRVKELPDDSAAALFLDVADCSECPVMKYDSNYIIPIEPIRFYNLMAVDLNELKDVHQNLVDEYFIRMMQIKTLNQIIDSKDLEAGNFEKIISGKDGIITEKDKQIIAEKKKLRSQKFKTYIVGGAGVVLCIVGILL